ncbi:unnamed protein product [Echinostoma caproni]|uniref:DUF4371 domain-containing protein n=1 Tax=Echinostoma caproni TaxID=27848 RepID=A0A183A6P4_9TREM|nr:unnamed protein product [Echinostoma caproni]
MALQIHGYALLTDNIEKHSKQIVIVICLIHMVDLLGEDAVEEVGTIQLFNQYMKALYPSSSRDLCPAISILPTPADSINYHIGNL